MSKIVEIAEQALLERQRLPQEFGPETVRPAYDGLSLANAAALAQHWLAPDAPRFHDQPALPPLSPELLGVPEVTAAWQAWQAHGPINHVVLLLMDALGYDQLRTMMADGVTPNLAAASQRSQGFFMPITSVYPSTTTTALTAAATAYAPAQHGVMGTVVYLREIGSMVNFIGFRPALAPTAAPYLETQLDPDTLVPVPNLYRRLEAAGVRCEIVNYHQFKGSSISRFTSTHSQAGQSHYYGYMTPADGFAQLRQRLQANGEGQKKTFTYAYVPNVDTAAHRYGPLSDQYLAEVAALDFTLNRELLAPLAGRSDVALLLVADHGQRIVEQSKIAWLNDHPELTRLLAVPASGESRALYLHLKHGTEETALNYINRHLGEHFLALPKAQAVAMGLFGLAGEPLGPECDDRIGDLLLIPRHDWLARQHLTSDGRHYPMIGSHGGLSRAEMLIPFLAYRFG